MVEERMNNEQDLRRTEDEVRQVDGGGVNDEEPFRTFGSARASTSAGCAPATDTLHHPSAAITLSELCRDAHERAARKGFYDPPPSIESRLCLIHSEVSEALEAYRDDAMQTTLSPSGKPEGFPSELADIVIRVCDFAGHLGIDLENEVRIKSAYNETRPPKHGRVRL
jgi:NTP pyrophosphatase (non-canonical NTP hydrolase)